VVRVRPAQRWTLTGSGCLESGKNEVTVVDTRAPGQLTLRLQPSLLPRGDSDDTC
jgi:hypothetical protein